MTKIKACSKSKATLWNPVLTAFSKHSRQCVCVAIEMVVTELASYHVWRIRSRRSGVPSHNWRGVDWCLFQMVDVTADAVHI